ncbi:malto-oligosyltrehalose synthase [Pseudoxanthomonas spadix]|jgi:(1->4)-alpha-D-glucan 1-alpha-D-glucosylmutase|uniref:(1->4)-alpha-D-glucan 1-alpha-D-glucosylmutase n=1 Tax=Pseudoxanthomonas spadix (strain BD-a59) TaxID=1045855 RepID=G7UUQ9_PSEUP|nr:malto-oligosyltrehalose synthase [Pseudoxanthomonas spadix]AER57532.1 (1->4)-alpha-D-glucan 1-alpha-D-glucosylmutase [Pseudoxanthomonas spadix BD-a59]MBP3973046.1 malto-oligosyltrehalose synthase [Pseudoxanthomonas spadix]RMW97192.1 malto-oligosyltrehalose synthase [Pseudoxanthomonas spadix]
MTELRATARLQLHAGFTLGDAAAQVPYFARLGVSHLYLSPIGTAVPGSTHGYDVTDPGQVNPELGGEAALMDLHAAAQARGMGLILDIVPNHMAAHAHNPWWWDVLRHGRRSRHADWFDIDWRSPGHDGKLWLPVLDRPYAQALAEGALKLGLSEAGELQLEHHQACFPVRVDGASLPQDLELRRDWARQISQGAVRGEDTLHRLLERQAYRLAWWRVGNDMVNYRRFFDITSLAAIRVERPDVFNAVHALPLRLIGEGVLDGLRLDHVDGLADPRGYLRRLRAQVDRAGRRRGLRPGTVVLLVEKILAPGERLPRDWPVQGTTGYDFMDQVSGVLHDPHGQAPLTRLWVAHSGRSGDFSQEEFQARGELLEGSLQAEFNRALQAATATARLDLACREFSPQMLAAALAAVMRRFPVYRTYAGNDGLDARDADLFDTAAQAAREGAHPGVQAAIDALRRWMRDAPQTPTVQRSLRRVLRRRMEQLSAPLNAKSVEDTSFYRHGVLLSRNEVGSHPLHLALDTHAFHRACQARAAGHQRAMLATATHDHKRGEDLRMRLAVLSAQPAWWVQQVEAFTTLARQLGLAPGAGGPDAGDALMLWQMLVGAWPLALEPDDAHGLAAFAERMAGWQAKALREAKLRSTWTEPDERYEAAARALLDAALVQDAGKTLRHAVHAAAQALGPLGAINGLAQATLRLTTPGVPDLYQGTEGWDLSLVDPDNRRPVDFALRQQWLDDPAPWPALLQQWRSGQCKARLVAQLLQLRASVPELFARGDYKPLRAEGHACAQVLAFRRQHGDTALVVAVPRLLGGVDIAVPSLPADYWQDGALVLPDGRYRHLPDGRVLEVQGRHMALAELFLHSPVAVLATLQ